jgi:hypothetical protein
MNRKEQNLNEPQKSQLNIGAVSSSTVIDPISCELSESMKKYIDVMKWVNENYHEHITRALMIPKEYFGSK